MALEQTINADAKSRLKGIMAYADVSSAVNRWMVTGCMRTQIVNSLPESADLKNYNADNKELNKPRMERDKADLEQLKNIITSTINPFDKTLNPDVFFNLKTGKQSSPNAEKYLLNIFTDGAKRRDNFVSECCKRPARFEEAIHKTNIVNFAAENFQKQNKSSKAAAILQAKGTRDMFGRLLFLSVKREIDMNKVFQFPLLPEPPCFAHPDGSLRDSPKSKVYHMLRNSIQSVSPPTINTAVADGIFLLKSHITHSPTYKVVARKILSTVLNLTTYIADLCFDIYESPSIKDVKRRERGEEGTWILFSIGPQQKIGSDIAELMSLSSFKKELLRFLFKEYEDQIYAPLIAEKILYCAIDNECKKFYCADGMLRYELVPDLYGLHLEADTRVMFHVKHADFHDPGNIIVRANDADICVILTSNVHHLSNSHLWYDSGLDYDNSREHVDITSLSRSRNYTKSLAGAYAFLGIDYSPAFFGKGKVKPLEIMTMKNKFLDAFASLGENVLTVDIMAVIEEFVCWMYGYRKQSEINEVIRMIFEEKSKPKANQRPLDCIKAIDTTKFPPCKKVLEQQIKRA